MLNNVEKELNVSINYSDDDGKLLFKVNWKAMGEQDADKARRYGEALIEAADLADRLNELEIEVNYTRKWDDPENEAEDMRNFGYIVTLLM